MNALNAAADADPAVLRVSLDAKAAVKIGPFSRGGTSRSRTDPRSSSPDIGSKSQPSKRMPTALTQFTPRSARDRGDRHECRT